MSQAQAYTLSQLTRRIASTINQDGALQGVWVIGETADVRRSGGHCYLELIEKDPTTGKQLAKARANIWANAFSYLGPKFKAETGEDFRSDLQVMVYVSVTFHPVYGLSLNISAINAAYTLGDAMRRRMEILEKLKDEGVLELNKQLAWPTTALRIAVISAEGAAGYGDFTNQLYNNAYGLRFVHKLFAAVMQGERTVETVIGALNQINDEIDNWDCVVIIRGGGATSELAAFDNYELAANIAQFGLPVIIGIGHERDVTVLDYVANMRVKTPTAAAEWLIGRGAEALAHLQAIASGMLQAVSDRLNGCHRQLSIYEGQLPSLAQGAVIKAKQRLLAAQMQLATTAERRIRPGIAKIDMLQAQLPQLLQAAISMQKQKLEGAQRLLEAISPEATLRRGYTITRIAGHAIGRAQDVQEDEIMETVFADGSVLSRVLTKQ